LRNALPRRLARAQNMENHMSDIASMITNLGETYSKTTSDLTTRLGDLEKRAARERDHSGEPTGQSLGSIVTNDPEVQRMTSNFRGQAVVKLTGDNAAITTANPTVGTGRSASTSLVPSHRLPDIIEPYERQLTVRDLLPQARTTSGSIEWPKET